MLELGLSLEQLNSIGTVLGTHTKEEVINIQKNYLEQSRLKLPLVLWQMSFTNMKRFSIFHWH